MQGTALAPRTLQFDVNHLAFQAYDGQGVASPFAGTTHTGRLDLFEETSLSELLSLSIRNGVNPFIVQNSYTGTLTDMAMSISLSGGNVTGGTLTLDVNGGPSIGGERYTATFSAAGNVTTYVGGGFKLEGLSFGGNFNDANFSGVPIADFFAAQGGPFLSGDFIAFKVQPTGTGSGHADTDIRVTTVPTQGAVACFALAGLTCAKRRRR